MKHVAAFQPQLESASALPEEWDRLPWLRDEPRRVRRRRYGALLGIVLAVSADAIASYSAGRLGLQSRQVQAAGVPAVDMRDLAERISTAASAGWNQRRPAAPY